RNVTGVETCALPICPLLDEGQPWLITLPLPKPACSRRMGKWLLERKCMADLPLDVRICHTRITMGWKQKIYDRLVRGDPRIRRRSEELPGRTKAKRG